MISKGSYCLCIGVEREVAVEVGALGGLVFPPGRYIYVGSAMNGLGARISRHLNTSRGVPGAVHWHVDYLLKEEEVRIEAVYTLASEDRTECSVAAAVSKRGRPVKGFGCSDCRCESHLFRVEDFGFLLELGLEPWLIDVFHSSSG
ncbi:MAG: GIY-YIG nuclease family protein [Candidatus Bathyarchaeota archaeon]|nr:GIY-YIG nuclease family protein [Candidatus Bathyarchaeota archaeon]